MERRRFLIGTAAVSTLLLAGCSSSDGSTPEATSDDESTDDGSTPDDGPTPSTPEAPTTDYPSEVLNGSFEDDLTEWTVGRDLPEDPNNSGQPVDSSV